jgi:hypothetical protein
VSEDFTLSLYAFYESCVPFLPVNVSASSFLSSGADGNLRPPLPPLPTEYEESAVEGRPPDRELRLKLKLHVMFNFTDH